MATEIKLLYPQLQVTLIHSRERLLSAEPLPDEFKDRVGAVIRDTGVELILGQRVIDTTAVEEKTGRLWSLTLADGRVIKAGHVLSAVSRCTPTSSYLPPQALDEEGHVRIQPWCVLLSLQLTSANDAGCNSRQRSRILVTTLLSATWRPGPASNAAVRRCTWAIMRDIISTS
jgi:hypothetical protein